MIFNKTSDENKIKIISIFLLHVIFVPICFFLIIFNYKIQNLSLCHETGYDYKAHEQPVPPSDTYCAAWNYDYKKTLEYVMDTFNYEGPSNYYGDKIIDCKDWAVTFLYRWYTENTVPDGTCVIVRQVNKRTRFDHALVAVWTGKKWLVIEPQSYNRNDWSPESYWGKRYDPDMNQYNQTRDFILYAFKGSYGYERAKKLIERTNVEATYGKSKVYDFEIVPDFMYQKLD